MKIRSIVITFSLDRIARISAYPSLRLKKINGYNNPEYWDIESWKWKQQYNVQHPKFWIPNNNGYRYRTVFDEIDLPQDFPVEVNHYEAMAYCRWQGAGNRLLTEAEWKLATGIYLLRIGFFRYYSERFTDLLYDRVNFFSESQ